jgi:hypothetical protein
MKLPKPRGRKTRLSEDDKAILRRMWAARLKARAEGCAAYTYDEMSEAVGRRVTGSRIYQIFNPSGKNS